MFLSQAFGDNRLPPKMGLGVPKERGLTVGDNPVNLVKKCFYRNFQVAIRRLCPVQGVRLTATQYWRNR